MQRNENRSISLPCTKFKSKCIKDPNIKPTTLNLIEKKVGSTLECIGTGDHFLNRTPAAQTLRETINKWDLLKLRSFCKANNMVSETKWQPTEWEKIFTNPTMNRGLISKIYKKLKKLINTRTNIRIKKWGTGLNRELSTEESKMVERHLRKCSTSLAIREMKITAVNIYSLDTEHSIDFY